MVVAGAGVWIPLLTWRATDVIVRPGSPLPFIAYGYIALLIPFALGALFSRHRPMRWVQRVAYAGLLSLAAIPSFVLLPLMSLTMGIAGLALVRSQRR